MFMEKVVSDVNMYHIFPGKVLVGEFGAVPSDVKRDL